MKNRFLSVILSIIFTICCLPFPASAAETSGFSDVKADDWFAPYVEVCVEEGLMEGTSDSSFSPDRELTWEECAVLTLRLNDTLRIVPKESN